jgi:penicillin-binding protein 1C
VRWIWLIPVAVLPACLLLCRVPQPLFSDPYATVIESREGRLLGASIAADGQWRFPPADTVADKVKYCLLVFEDQYFYYHPGVNPFSLVRAARQNLAAGSVVSGGSTITMQVVRLMRRGQPRTILEKCIEILLAARLELRYSKEDILGLYAGHAPFGGNVVGIAAASWRYYGRPPELLSWGEAAALAVLPNSPSLVYPGKNDHLLRQKRDLVLSRLVEKQVITGDEARLAAMESLPGKPRALPRLAPRLLTRAIGEGMTGQRIKTTIDSRLQHMVNQKVMRHQRLLEGNMVHNAAALVIEVATGKALVYVGNVDSEGDHSQQSDLIMANRSTGSLLKPFLYALAVQEGRILPGQMLPDIPIHYKGFTPKNFDEKFHGAVPADKALSRSLNVPFVQLLQDYGYERFYHDLRSMKYRSMVHAPGHYGLSMILGGSESSLWQITALYAGAARVLLNFNTRKGDKRYSADDFFDNTFLDGRPTAPARLSDRGPLDAGAAWWMLRAMQELRRPDEYSGWRMFSSSRPIAWKTGTSFGFRDAWAVGLNERYVVGVWIGNADGEGRAGLTGLRSAAPLMFDVFSLLQGHAEWPRPVAAMRSIDVCAESGFKSGAACTRSRAVYLPKEVGHTPFCPYHRVLNLDETMQHQVNSACYAVSEMKQKTWFVLPPVQAWYYKQYNPHYVEPPDFLPACGNAAEGAFLALIYPRQYTRIFVPRELDGRSGRTVFEAAHRDPRALLYWYIDDTFVGKTQGLHQMGVAPEQGAHRLIVYDDKGRETAVHFEVVGGHGRQ